MRKSATREAVPSWAGCRMGERTDNPELMALARAIVTGDSAEAVRLLRESPPLATARFWVGATRQVEQPYFLHEIARYIYAGDTALHIAAAAYRIELVNELLIGAADVHAKNRRGAEPLHAAADQHTGVDALESASTSNDHHVPDPGRR